MSTLGSINIITAPKIHKPVDDAPLQGHISNYIIACEYKTAVHAYMKKETNKL